MASPSVSYFSRILLCVFFLCLALIPTQVQAQEYTEEQFKAYESIQAEKDINQKTDLIVKFLRDQPKTADALRPNVKAEFQKIAVDLRNQKSWSQLIALCDKYLDVAPNDQVAIAGMTAAYEATNNMKGFAASAERLYTSRPSVELALAIAKAYKGAGNIPKFVQWSEKTLAQDPNNVEMLAEVTKIHMTNRNMAQAVKYAKLTLKVLPTAKKPEESDAAYWKELVNTSYATAYSVIGASAYENRNYAEAIRNLDSGVKYFKRNDVAYYTLGMSYWQQNKLEPAMLNFAKAYILRGSTSASAKKYLDQLWGTRPKAGMQRILDRAQQDFK